VPLGTAQTLTLISPLSDSFCGRDWLGSDWYAKVTVFAVNECPDFNQ
jgi:hypothetical protein